MAKLHDFRSRRGHESEDITPPSINPRVNGGRRKRTPLLPESLVEFRARMMQDMAKIHQLGDSKEDLLERIWTKLHWEAAIVKYNASPHVEKPMTLEQFQDHAISLNRRAELSMELGELLAYNQLSYQESLRIATELRDLHEKVKAVVLPSPRQRKRRRLDGS